MSVRLDFASISKIILDNRKSDGLSYMAYYEKLFSYALSQEDMELSAPEPTQVGRIIKGERSVHKDVVFLYGTPQGGEGLKSGILEVLSEVSDTAYVREQLEKTIRLDSSMSKEKKIASQSKCFC